MNSARRIQIACNHLRQGVRSGLPVTARGGCDTSSPARYGPADCARSKKEHFSSLAHSRGTGNLVVHRRRFQTVMRSKHLNTRDFVTRFDWNNEHQLMLWTIIVILLVLWLLGLLGHVGGSLIHLLLVIAVVVLIINLVSGRRPL